jgi:hypothetical protein
MTAEMYTKIDNHVEIAKARQVYQYKNLPNWENLLTIHVERLQYLENVYYQLLTERSLSTAVGVQLDLLGLDYNLTRNASESDEDFRARIGVEISALQSFGQVSVLNTNLLRLVAPRAISLKQIFPLKILMWIFVDDVNEFTTEEEERIERTMQEVKAAGVGLEVFTQLSAGFQFSSTLLSGDPNRGFATTIGGTDGGAFAKIIE